MVFSEVKAKKAEQMDYQPIELGESSEVAAIEDEHDHLGLTQIMSGLILTKCLAL